MSKQFRYITVEERDRLEEEMNKYQIKGGLSPVIMVEEKDRGLDEQAKDQKTTREEG